MRPLGQFFHFLRSDCLTDRGIFRGQERGISGDRDRLRGVTDFELGVNNDFVSRAKVDVLADVLFEARTFRGNVVITRQQEGSGVLARGIRDGLVLSAGVDFSDGYFHAPDTGAPAGSVTSPVRSPRHSCA